MAEITVYASAFCPYCMWAKRLLNKKSLEFTEIRVDQDPEQYPIMIQRAGRDSVPQIFIGDHHVGGYDDLAALERSGELDPLIERS